MYFITAGEVEVTLREGKVTLGEGDFFGAVALLNRRPSPISVQALRKTHLLCIAAEDFFLHAGGQVEFLFEQFELGHILAWGEKICAKHDPILSAN